ncbi:MAG: VCBS repeat-containing protein, partial [Nitrospiria bacterium]
MSYGLIACVVLLAGCGTEDFPGSPNLAGERDVPYVTTYNFGFQVRFDNLSGADGNLQIISGGDLLNLISAANITQTPGTGVLGGRVFSPEGTTLADVVLAATDAAGRKLGDFFYNGLGGTPDFVQTRGTVASGGFTAFNVPPGEVFLKAVAGGRGGTRLVSFADEVSLGTVLVAPVVLPIMGVTGEINDTAGTAIAEGTITIEVLGQSLGEAGDCNDEVPSQDAVDAQQFSKLTAFRFCVASDGDYLTKLTGDERFVTTYYPFRADRAQLAAQQAADLTVFFSIQTQEGMLKAERGGGRAWDKSRPVIAGQVTVGDGGPLKGAVIRVTDRDGVARAVANGTAADIGTIWYLDESGVPMSDQAETGAKGRFLIINLPVGVSPLYLSVTAEQPTTGLPERFTATAVTPVFAGAVMYQPVKMTLAPTSRSGEENRDRYFTGPVSGRVMTEDGLAPVPAARLTSLGVPQSELASPPPQVFVADADGGYKVMVKDDDPRATTPLLGSSEYVVKVEGPTADYVPTYQRIVTGPAVLKPAPSDEFQTKVQNLSVVTTAALTSFASSIGLGSSSLSGGIIYGTVVDRTTGLPAEGITVRLLPFSGAAVRVYYFSFAGVPRSALGATTGDGRFIAFNVPPGMVSIDVISPDDSGNLLLESMDDGVTLVRLQANNAPPDTVDVVSTLDPLIGTVGSGVNLGVVGGDPLLRKQRCPAHTTERGGLCYDSAGVTLAKEFVPCDQLRVVRDGYCVIAGVSIPSTGVTVPVGSQSDLVMKTSGVGYLDTYTFGLRTGERAAVNAAVGAVRSSDVANLAAGAGLERKQGMGLIWGRTTTAGLGDLDAAGNPVPMSCGTLGRTWTDLNDRPVGCDALGIPSEFVAGHFNADASLDLAVIDASAEPAVTIWLNRGDGRFVMSQRIVRDLANCYAGTVGCGVENGPSVLLVMDFNADGFSDLVVLNRESRTVSLLEGRGRGLFIFWGSLVIGTSDSDFSTMASADLNRDGWQDLLLTDRVSGQISLLLGEGSGLRPFRPTLLPVRVGNEPRAVASGHLDTDGIPDLVFANRDSVAVMTRIGVGEILSSYTFPSDQPTDLSAVAVGDLNGDGIHDVVAADAYPGRSRLWIFLHGVTPGAIPTSIA